jgi:LysR family transcriptional regulator, glycine cleavage system transcriptional activator
MIVARLHPPIHLLRAFIATARHLSISRAAEELCLTQSAVSKQVIELEATLGTHLFERVRKRLVLSPAGQRYLGRVEPLVKALEAATLEIIAHGDSGGALHLSSLPSFGAKWLIPRLPDFRQRHPDVTLHFVPFAQGYDFHLPELDCAIRYGEGTWPGAMADYLTGRTMVVIAPPRSAKLLPLRKPQDAARHVLLQHATVPRAWEAWCQQHQVRGINPLAGPTLDQYTSLVHAVMAGMGLALVPRCLVQDELDAGVVTAPLDDTPAGRFRMQTGYHLCYPESKAQVPALRAFREWLLGQAQAQEPAAASA